MNRDITLLDGKHELKYSFWSLRKMEAAFGKPMRELKGDEVNLLLAFVYAGVLHENKKLTLDELAEKIPLKIADSMEVLKQCVAVHKYDSGLEENIDEKSDGEEVKQ